MSLRFSSRVPNKGSRLGVISRAIFKGFVGLLSGEESVKENERSRKRPRSAYLLQV